MIYGVFLCLGTMRIKQRKASFSVLIRDQIFRPLIQVTIQTLFRCIAVFQPATFQYCKRITNKTFTVMERQTFNKVEVHSHLGIARTSSALPSARRTFNVTFFYKKMQQIRKKERNRAIELQNKDLRYEAGQRAKPPETAKKPTETGVALPNHNRFLELKRGNETGRMRRQRQSATVFRPLLKAKVSNFSVDVAKKSAFGFFCADWLRFAYRRITPELIVLNR